MVGFPQDFLESESGSMPPFMSVGISEIKYRQDVDVKVCLPFGVEVCIESRYGQT